MNPRSPILRQLSLLALGALVFAGGVILARAWLPEWRTDLLGKRFYVERYRELARRVGARPAGQLQVAFTRPEQETSNRAARRLDALSPDAAAELGAGLLVQVRQPASLAGIANQTNELILDFTPGGNLWSLRWGRNEEAIRTSTQSPAVFPAARRADLLRLFLRPGERLGEAVVGNGSGGDMVSAYPLLGSRPPQRISVIAPPGGTITLRREIGGDKEPVGARVPDSEISEIVLLVIPVAAGALTAVILFLVLLGKRRIDFVNATWIGAFLAVAAAIPTLVALPNLTGVLEAFGACFVALWAFVVWSAGESYLRAVLPGLVAGLDALRAGRLGPRGGQALAEGVACGALLAGFKLAALAAASRLPGLWLKDSSLRFPLFGVLTPFNDGVLLAGGAVLFLGLAHRFLPPRRAPWAAALAGGMAVPFASLRPPGWQALLGVAAIGFLILVGRRAGLAAILAAAVCAELLPAAAFSALHLSWLPVAFVVTAGVPLLLLVAGLAGMRRPDWAERERVRQPAFIRRLEDERRLRYEMDLLARMQRELLPEKPEVPGWEIAVDSLLATEAGGDLYDFLRDEEGNLWIAAGDVAGHGYSCAIVQAMTAAALTSTITAAQTPSQVLREVDRVIRRGGAHRNFTSLALVRLDPQTGEALLGNAGHPFPLLLAHGGEVEEIDLPGLPLGQGPHRRYADLPFRIPPGGALVFCSDGLFEATGPRDSQYGYDRPRERLRALGNGSAAEILAALFADWRAYTGADGPPADDTTVLVLKRT
ncbi:MAG TPA: PP2C family protein-serine/threonine phosphatase [Thermoanaerobaculia bacterium]